MKRKKSNIAEKIIEELGFGGLIKGLMGSPAFTERLQEVNEELEKRLREGKDFRIERRFAGRKGGFKIESNISVRPLIPEKAARKEVHPEKIEKEDLVDIFDENGNIRIITELPNAKEDIRLEVKDDSLAIFVGSRERKRIKLPCPAEVVSKRYKNNILEVRLKKVSK